MILYNNHNNNNRLCPDYFLMILWYNQIDQKAWNVEMTPTWFLKLISESTF